MDLGYATLSHFVSDFGPEENGVWTMAWWNGDLCLVYIKTSATPNNKVEVHIASGASGYKSRVFEGESDFTCENNGVWAVSRSDTGDPPDLIYIKTGATPNNMVEVHIASGSSRYKSRSLEVASTFNVENDGVWAIPPEGSDLGFIKTANTGTNTVELHVASRASNYQVRTFEQGTGFDLAKQGIWSWMYNGYGFPIVNLIKPVGTDSGSVEVYGSIGTGPTLTGCRTPFGAEDNGYWMLFDTALVYIKTRNTASGMVEVHTAA